MFGSHRQKSAPAASAPGTDAATDVAPEPAAPAPSAGKGRPTPKRREREAARRTPLVPADREAAKKAAREKARAERAAQREALARGDERALPPRDRGPVRRYLRDAVDSRLNIGEILLPLMLVVLALVFVQIPAVQAFAMIAVWVIVIVGVLDAVLLWRRTRKEVVERFGEEPPRGSAAYLVMRAMQMRISRVPRPQVSRGDRSWKERR